MDNYPPDDLPPATRFVPDRRYTALAAFGAVGALVAALLTDDRAGRLLFAVGVVVLACYVVADLVFSPRVTASRAGIVINGPLTRARLGWDEVAAVRADTRLRWGVRNTTLEIDAGDRLLAVFSRRALGAEPDDAAARIEAFRPR